MGIQHHFSLKKYNTFGIEASASRFITIHTVNELREVLDKETDVFVLSGGSNMLLVNDIDSQSMHFKLINNIIIIPLEVNGSELNFILDTGVSSPVIFNLKSSDSIRLNQLKKIKLRGLGEGNSVDALRSKNNRIRFDNIVGSNQNLFLIYNL